MSRNFFLKCLRIMPIHRMGASACSPEASNGLKTLLMLAKRRSSNHRGVSIVQSKKDSTQIDMCDSYKSSICKVLTIFFSLDFNILIKPKGGPGMGCRNPQSYAWTDVVLDKGYQVCLAIRSRKRF